MFSQKWETDPAVSVDDRSTCACVAPPGATPATDTRCHAEEDPVVGTDQVIASWIPPNIQRIPIRSPTTPAVSANA
jgi:hypothetical protein